MPAANDSFRVDATGADGRHEQWQSMLSSTHLPWATRLSPADAPFEASVKRWWIDDLALVDCDCGPSSGTRQRRQIAMTDGDFFIVLMKKSGNESVTQNDVTVDLSPGDAIGWDSTRPARFTVWQQLSKRSLIIPRSAIEEVGGAPWARSGVRLESTCPATQLLTMYLDSLSTSLPMLSQSALSAARNATLELLIGALRPDTVGVSSWARPAIRDAIDRYIEQHLLDRELSPGSIAQAHGVSVRTVNRVFNATGQTVSDVVRVRRLARARTDLAETSSSVAAIANKWGFSDASHLSRTFKAHYGASPRDFRSAQAAAAN
ncbi:helix-turn-helix domain-containing protein [Gordonia sp. TBRC 11910]|uniref:Helix-turn-helix domain-containing protein n=1 Tax=Gordonia asplenii TaxID=2725283 RepID=A0A848L211_9ACTN|nr:helix-turn-helix domain-containing protein [Gordonia asplenii]NMO02643.1 helix-turn-helix domain-containing protein [Gordonia asplenii]